MPYKITDAIKDEIKLLVDLQKHAETTDKFILVNMYKVQRESLERIINRFEGKDYRLGTNNEGKPTILYKNSSRKTLEEEYPSLREAAERYDMIETLVYHEPNLEK